MTACKAFIFLAGCKGKPRTLHLVIGMVEPEMWRWMRGLGVHWHEEWWRRNWDFSRAGERSTAVRKKSR